MSQFVMVEEYREPDFYMTGGPVYHRPGSKCAQRSQQYGISRHELHFVPGIRPCLRCKPAGTKEVEG